MFKKILVPLDGSALSEQALPHAVRLARALQIPVVLVQAVELSSIMMPAPAGEAVMWPEASAESLQTMANTYLNDLMALPTSEDVTFTGRVEIGDPATIILDVADEERADLIIMSTHGRSGVNRWLLGSITERVLRHADCPVLAVRSAEPLEHMLVTLDGSPLSEVILPFVTALAQIYAAKLTFLRVHDTQADFDASLTADVSPFSAGVDEMVAYDLETADKHYLSDLVSRYVFSGLETRCIVTRGQPAPSILGVAETYACDTIAMSTHGRTGVRRWMYGSVTEKVLRLTDRAMLIVRPPVDKFE